MKCTVGWDGLLAWQWHIFTLTEERLMQRNRFFSIKSVMVVTVKIKHNSYGKIIRDKMMTKIIIIKKKPFSNIMKEVKIWENSDFSSFVLIFFFHPYWITWMTC